jgi:hypothetical protein
MTIDSADNARKALGQGDLVSLLGMRECGWLEVKSRAYRLDNPGDKAELLKDVAQLANAQGGLLLIGFATAKTDGRDVLIEVSALAAEDLDPEKYRKTLRSGVCPTIRDLRVERLDAGSGQYVLMVDVPAQRDADKPFVVPGPAVGKLFPSVAVPIRDDDGTHWLGVSELQRMLAAGWAATGGLSEQVLRALAEAASDAVSRSAGTGSQPEFRVGVGEPGWLRSYQQLYNAVGGVTVLGEPVSHVHWDGPAVVQYFELTWADDSMVIAALPGNEPVAMSGTLWNEVCALGGGAPRDGGVAAVGLPLPGTAPALIDKRATTVELSGGTWGKGRLVRGDAELPWRWEPEPKTSFEASRGRNQWVVGSENWHVCVRVFAHLPWLTQSELTVEKAGRERLLAALQASELTASLERLSARRGATLPAPRWERARDTHSWHTNTSAHHAAVIPASAGSAPGVTARLRLQCPSGMQQTVTACAEVLFDFGAWHDALQAAGAAPAADMRLTVEDLLDLLPSCWQAATQIAPLGAVADPASVPLTGPPVVEFYLQSPYMQGGVNSNLDLPSFIDLSAFGEQMREQLPEMSISLTAPVDLDRLRRRDIVRRLLVEMAHGFGFIDADEESLPGNA